MWELLEQDSNIALEASAHTVAPGARIHTKEQNIWRMALTRIPGIGVVSMKKLITIFGEAAEVFRASRSALLSAGLSKESAQAILQFDAQDQLKAELQWLIRNGVRLLYFTDAEYPQRLISTAKAPPLLYYRGTADLNAKKIVAVVGTRNADEYGRQIARELIAQLRPADPLIISGLALGIDTAAHKAALENDLPTVGVLGHGFGKLYPAANAALSKAMVRQGGLLTSFAYHVTPERYNFPMRNTIVAGLCDALIVVQTRQEGGSMITVGLAQKFGKKIFAVPGRLSDSRSEGCNQLIRQGVAKLLCSGEQLAAELGWTWPEGGKGAQASLDFGADQRVEDTPEGRLLQVIREKENPDIDELVLCSRLDASAVAMLLLRLELRGAIVALPGKRYMPVSAARGN
jgi:DNA processing protein